MAWNRVSTLGWASNPANAGVTRVRTSMPPSMNRSRLSATSPVPGSGSSAGVLPMIAATWASSALASSSSLSSK